MALTQQEQLTLIVFLKKLEGVKYFFDSQVQNSSFVQLMKFSSKNYSLLKVSKGYKQT